jgi:hypothetical protein
VHVNGRHDAALPASASISTPEDLAVRVRTLWSTGRDVDGILTFILAKTAASDISNKNTSIVVHFKDSQGNSYQTGKATVGAKR